MSKKTLRAKSAQSANQMVFNIEDFLRAMDRVQQAVDKVSGWYANGNCGGECFPQVYRWWDTEK